MAPEEDVEIKPKIIYQEDYQKTRLYKLADEYVEEYFDYGHLRTIESLYGSERANETARNLIRDVLTAAPELPATTLAQDCYEWMFYGCTSLTAAPELPATTLANGYYNWMFYVVRL